MENHVNTDFINWYNTGRSRLALAFLNSQNDADYLFYKMQSEDEFKLHYPQVSDQDLVLFGSYYGIKPEIREGLAEFLKEARHKGSLIVYDPNFRKSHLNMLEQVRPFIYENIQMADVVKGSLEDFGYIFNLCDPDKIIKRFSELGGKTLILTCAGRDVYFNNQQFAFHLPVPFIVPVSTIGAGDSFSASLIYGLLSGNVTNSTINMMSESDWKKIVQFSIDCAIDVCLSYENYISAGVLSRR
jgi:fructokinase